ncbi:lipoprotein [Burkholderia pseudomallei]|nr:lipoprotein [Burkholderia pseudomallei]
MGVGIAVQAATDEAVNRTMKQLHKNQQDAIAQAAGGLAVGETRAWQVKNRVPLENGEGEVRVTRAFQTPLALCKEFAFSVKDGSRADWYLANACQDAHGWQWASAEPAVERWGNLQ